MTAPWRAVDPAIIVLGQRSLEAARRIQGVFEAAVVYGLNGRVEGADETYAEFGATVRGLFGEDRPIVALCSAGIVIRALAPLLADKRAEPPVIAVAEDGSAVVPLLGGLRGANALARRIAEPLGAAAAITTTGEIRFGLTLEDLPPGYKLSNPQDGKRFLADLLAGAKVRIVGDAPWLEASRLPRDPAGALKITLTTAPCTPGPGELVIHPQTVAVAIAEIDNTIAARIDAALVKANLSRLAVACILAPEREAASSHLHAAAAILNVPVRLLPWSEVLPLAGAAALKPARPSLWLDGVVVEVATTPINPDRIGRGRGSLSVVGLGPGDASLLAPAARAALSQAQDILGYGPYLKQGGPYRPDQRIHESDNREELDRARHAFRLAAEGRDVAVVSSGDPGVFAMAAAVMEALDGADDAAWQGVRLQMIPGISAAMGAAALAGAPLGHDFAMISLSDNLKPWSIIASRLDAAGAADLVVALYNPISQARPTQFGEAMAVLRRHRKSDTVVLLGHNIGRPGERLTVTTLGDLKPEQVDMRTVVIVGSSQTRRIERAGGTPWVYTPRSYPKD